MPLFMKVAEALDIPYVVLADTDIKEIKPEWGDPRKAHEESENAKHQRWNKDIDSVCNKGRVFWLDPNFESVMGLPQNESEKIDRAIETFTAMKKDEVPLHLVDPIQALLKL